MTIVLPLGLTLNISCNIAIETKSNDPKSDCDKIVKLKMDATNAKWQSMVVRMNHECKDYIANNESCQKDLNEHIHCCLNLNILSLDGRRDDIVYYSRQELCPKFEQELLLWLLGHGDPEYVSFIDDQLKLYLRNQFELAYSKLGKMLDKLHGVRLDSPALYKQFIVAKLLQVYLVWSMRNYQLCNDLWKQLQSSVCWNDWTDVSMVSTLKCLVEFDSEKLAQAVKAHAEELAKLMSNDVSISMDK